MYIYIYTDIHIIYVCDWSELWIGLSCVCVRVVKNMAETEMTEVWNNKDFETFFEGHYEEWDFDAKYLGYIDESSSSSKNCM